MRFAAGQHDAAALGLGRGDGFLQVFGQTAGVAPLTARPGPLRSSEPAQQFVATGAEFLLGQHLLAQAAQLLGNRPEFVRCLLRAPAGHRQAMRQARQALGIGHHQRRFGHRRHQPRLEIHQHQLTVLRVQQHLSSFKSASGPRCESYRNPALVDWHCLRVRRECITFCACQRAKPSTKSHLRKNLLSRTICLLLDPNQSLQDLSVRVTPN